MKTVSVEGLPESIAAAVAQMVQTLQEQLARSSEPRQRVDFPRWPGKVLGSLTREEIYADVG